MTTPERLRRRQRFEGLVLLLLGVALVLQNRYFAHQNDAQDRCQQNQFAHLADTFQARAAIGERDSAIKTAVIVAAATAKDPQTVRKALAQFVVDQAALDAQRKNHPVPDFPTGQCKK